MSSQNSLKAKVNSWHLTHTIIIIIKTFRNLQYHSLEYIFEEEKLPEQHMTQIPKHIKNRDIARGKKVFRTKQYLNQKAGQCRINYFSNGHFVYCS